MNLVATTIETLDGWTRMVYHNTCVAEFNGKLVKLNTGGHFTATTKKRMNQFSKMFDLGFKVTSKNGAFYCEVACVTERFDDRTYAFLL